jgi:hypothetical protein
VSVRRRSLAIAGALAIVASSEVARADADDGAYGRLSGDVGLELGAGVAVERGGPDLHAELTAIYLGTAGVYGRYLDALGGEGVAAARSFGGGLVLRPLFLARFAKDREHGPARLDLMIDSIGLQLGAYVAEEHRGGLARDAGLELGLGVDVPFLSDASGPWLGVRTMLRFRPEDLEGRGRGDLLDAGAFVALTLGWHQIVGTAVADLGDTLER